MDQGIDKVTGSGVCTSCLSLLLGAINFDASRTVDALTAVIMYLHGDHFWPVMEAHAASLGSI